MYSEAEFLETATELARVNNLTQERAEELLARIGDTPEMEGDQVIVRDANDEEIARLLFPLTE